MYRGWKVAIAGFFINLVTGFVYTWSIIASYLHSDLGWDYTQASLPYTVFLLFYPPAMILTGRLQDILGPRVMIAAGAVVVSGATFLSTYMMTPFGIALNWGLLWGIGLACTFAAVTPAAIKWFEPSQKGKVTGVVVFGMGISAFITAPIVNFGLENFGFQLTFRAIALFILFVVILLSLAVGNPPREAGSNHGLPGEDMKMSPGIVFRQPQLYILWLIFCFISGTGVTFVSHLDTIARVQFSVERGFVMVSLFSFFNAWGRITAGFLSDRLGRRRAMILNYTFLALILAAMLVFRGPLMLVLAVAVLGLGYGGLFSLIPATVSSFFGDENFGFVYGLIFSGMTFGGLFPLVAGRLFEVRGDFTLHFAILLIACFSAVLLSLLVKPPAAKSEPEVLPAEE